MNRNGSMLGQLAHTLMIGSMLAWSVMPAGRLCAAPAGESVQAGSADFVRNGDLTQITASDGAIINYDSFNIGASETVQFIQPDANSRVLNRINGADPTHIDGTLLSNGIVYIVNPAGVYFGQGALVNVGGIYTGAAQLSNADFLAGVDHFTNVSGNVVNRGTINGSLVALIGQHVANYGTISAPDGMITMLAGDDVIITGRDKHFSVRITGMGAEARREVDASAQGAVENHGTIDAGNGKVVWGAGDVYAMGIFNDGSVKAQTIEAAANGSDATIGGTLDATSATGNGGDVSITADHVAVTGTIDASGATDGGSIRIGGDMQGSGDLAHAQSTLITDSAYLLANAISGQGGKIIVWSDGNTYFYGTIEANDATSGGGGFVETSGHNLDFIGGSVTASGGTWLLDPTNITVDAAAASGIVATLDTGTNVTLDTSGGGADAGNIIINAAIAKTAGGDATFTLNADNDITVNAAISSTSNKLNVALNAANDATVSSTGSITTNGGTVAVTTTAGNQLYAAGAIDAGAGDVTLNSGGTIDESGNDQLAKIATTGTLTMDAVGTIGNTDGGNINSDSTPLFDVDAAIVDIHVTGDGSSISVKDQAAGGVQVNDLTADLNGFVRFDSVGPMTLNDNAVNVTTASAGAGFVWLVSDSSIDAVNPGNLVITTGPSANLRIDAMGDVGTVANPLVVDTTGLFVLIDRGDFANNPGGAHSFYGTNQRAGTTNIVAMMLDSGDAVVNAPGDINVSDFSSDFDTSFLGAGNLTLTSTTGGIATPSAITMNGGIADFTAATTLGSAATPINITSAGELDFTATGNAFVTAATLNGPLTNIAPAAHTGTFVSIVSANTHVDVSSDGVNTITFNQLQLPTPSGTFALAANATNIDIAAGAIDIPMTASQSISISADAGAIALHDGSIDGGAGSVTLTAGNGAITDADNSTNAKITTTGAVSLTATDVIGSTTGDQEIDVFDALDLTVNAPNGFALMGNGQTLNDVQLPNTIDPTLGPATYSFAGFDPVDNFTITTDGTDSTVSGLTIITFPFTMEFLSGNLSLGDIDASAAAGGDDILFETHDGNITLTGDINAGAGDLQLVAGSDGGPTGGDIINSAAFTISGTGSASLTARGSGTNFGSIGTLANPIKFTGIPRLSFNVDQNLYVDHDAGGANTRITSLTIAADPQNDHGVPSYLLTNFYRQSYSNDANAIRSADDGVLADNSLLINDARVVDGSDADDSTHSTSYSFTAKTGNLYVDDDGAASGTTPATFDGDSAGDGGIFSGGGNVTLVASRGSVLQELARDDFNVRTNSESSTAANLGPLVTIRANTAGQAGVVGSIGGDPTVAGSHFNIQNARRLVLDARDHIAVAGNNNVGGATPQPLELLDITADPDGPGVGTPLYDLIGFDSSLTFNVHSTSNNLVVTALQSTHTFDSDAQGTAFAVRARSGDLVIEDNAIYTYLHSLDPVITAEPALPSDVTNRSVRLQADGLLPLSNTLAPGTGSILLNDNAVTVDDFGGVAGSGNGTITLIARNAITEADVNTTAKLTTGGLVQLYADGLDATVTGDPVIGGTPVAGAANPSLDIAASSLIAQAGMNLVYLSIQARDGIGSPVQTTTQPGSINVANTGDLRIRNVDTHDGNVDIRAAAIGGSDPGAITLDDNAIVAGIDGNVTLEAPGGIEDDASASTSAVKITALDDQVLLLASAAIGGSNPINIEAKFLAGQVADNAGGFYVADVDTAVNDGLTINSVTDPLVFSINNPASHTIDGISILGDTGGADAIAITTVGGDTLAKYLQIDGHIVTRNPSAITFTASAGDILINNGGVGTDALPTAFQQYLARGTAGTGGAIFLGVDSTFVSNNDSIFFGDTSVAATLDTLGSAGADVNLVVNTRTGGDTFFSGNVGSLRPLASVTTDADGRTFVQGDITTSGGTQRYFDPFFIYSNDITLTDSGAGSTAGVYFYQTINTSNGINGLTINVKHDLTPDTATYPNQPELPLIEFGGDIGTSSNPLAFLHLNTGTPARSYVPTVATIVVANHIVDTVNNTGQVNPDRTNPIDFNVYVGHDFQMGANEKLTAIGSVTIHANVANAGITALTSSDVGMQLSDINADRTLTLDAGGTRVLLLNGTRSPVPGAYVPGGPDTGILYPTDANGDGILDEFANDNGLDFWGRDGIHINNASLVYADNTNTIRWYAMDAGTISGLGGVSGISSTTSLGYFPLITRAYGGGNIVLDLIPVDTHFNLGTVFPPPFPRLDDSVRLALTRHEFMNQLLVMTRDAAGGERLRRVLGNATFNDMSTLGARSASSNDTVLNRIREDMVPIVLNTYESLFYQQVKHDDGTTESLPRFDQLTQTLADGVAAYRSGTGTAPSDPVKFRTYFEQTGQSPETLATLDALRELYMQMAQLGLTDREWSNAVYAVTARITPKGISTDLIVMAALGQSYNTASAR